MTDDTSNAIPRLIARPLEIADIPRFVANLRQADLDECRVASTRPISETLHLTMQMGTANLIALPDGQPLVLWSVVPLWHRKGAAAVGLLATRLAEKHIHTLHSVLRTSLDTALHTYPVLTNYVWERNELHVRWLRRIGAQFLAYHPKLGPFNEPFFEFAIAKEKLSLFSRSIN